MLITFSGLDGSGKTTLIMGLKKDLELKGLKTKFLTTYDNISFYALIRNLRDATKKIFGINPTPKYEVNYKDAKNPPGIIPQDPKVDVSDKKTGFSKFVYRIIRSQKTRRTVLWLDLLVLIFYRFKEEFVLRRILITDRYLYDSLVDVIDLENKKWNFIKIFLHFLPTPLAPVFVDVPAEIAFNRKPEYPLEYTKWRRSAYRKLFESIKNPIIIANTNNLPESLSMLTEKISSRMSL